jgi:3-mercaptopyruvate sulfurtransferase SseA
VRILLEAASIAVAGALLGLGLNAASPRSAPLATPVHAAAESGGGMCATGEAAPAAPRARRISVEEAKGHCDACTAGFVDARSGTEYAAGHVTNAVHLPPAGHEGEAVIIAGLRAYDMVVVYDGEYTCALADEVAARLRREGLPDVRVLEGAWPAWTAAGGSDAVGICPSCHDHGEDAR